MARYERSLEGEMSRTYAEAEAPSGWAVGFILFAIAMLIMLGTFHIINGLAAVLNDDFYVVRPGYDLKLDVTAWGWAHMAGGTIMIIAGFALLTGALWARIVAIALAVVSGVGNFYSIPYYPVWSIMMIALDIGVIWALAAHGRELSAES
jgi:hypothetical protein